MIQAQHHRLFYPFLVWYSQRIVTKNFARVQINHTVALQNTSLLVIANHTSWWDGFWIHELVTRVFKRKFFFMMLEDQLRKSRFLKYFGGFSIKKNSRSIIESLTYSAQLLQNPANAVLIFPQGRLESLYTQDFIFDKGVEVILKKTESTQIVFVVNLIEYLSHSKPTLYVYTSVYGYSDTSVTALQYAYTEFYKSCIINHQKSMIE